MLACLFCRQNADRSCLAGLPVKGGAWLRRFDDVTGVEKSCIAKSKKRKNS